MVNVTNHNFSNCLTEFKGDIADSSFICLDFEFCGLHTNKGPTISLFDSPSERYQILRQSCRDFTILQCGITIFHYDKPMRVYKCKTYNFSLFPADFRSITRQTVFESSACEFLKRFDFDFNKCIYGGLSFLNEDEIETTTKESKRSGYVDGIVLNGVKSDFRMRKLTQLTKWYSEGPSGESISIDCFSRGMLEVIQADISEQFPNVTVVNPPGESSLLVITKVTPVEKEEFFKEKAASEERDTFNAIGFTHVVRLIREHKKPIIGHNILMDIMYLHEKCFKPLPESYEEFKSSVNANFPPIYDTRHIISNLKCELKSDLKHKETFRGTSLLRLYEECKGTQIRGQLYQPAVLDNLAGGTGMREHDAGYDSYLVGVVFVRLAHFYCLYKNSSPNIKPFHFQDYLRELHQFRSCLNLIRCHVTHIDLTRPDPETKRPQWLQVSTRDGSGIQVEEVKCTFSAFGDVSVRKRSENSCLVAMPSVNMAAGLLLEMRDHEKFKVDRYEPSHVLYQAAAAVSCVGVLSVVGGLFLFRNRLPSITNW